MALGARRESGALMMPEWRGTRSARSGAEVPGAEWRALLGGTPLRLTLLLRGSGGVRRAVASVL